MAFSYNIDKPKKKFINEHGDEELVKAKEFSKIKNLDLQLRNVANVVLNHFEDNGEEVALEYMLCNVPIQLEKDFRKVFKKEAQKRGVWKQ